MRTCDSIVAGGYQIIPVARGQPFFFIDLGGYWLPALATGYPLVATLVATPRRLYLPFFLHLARSGYWLLATGWLPKF